MKGEKVVKTEIVPVKLLAVILAMFVLTDFTVEAVAATSDIGYAILVAGPDEKGLSAIDTYRAYETLLRRGFDTSRIFYISSGGSNLDALRSAFNWASVRVGPDSPLILYFAGEGGADVLVLQDAQITPSEVTSPIHWALESGEGLGRLPLGTPTLIILDSCFSGGFITTEDPIIDGIHYDDLGTVSGPNRIIITSAHHDRETPMLELSGSFFSHELWLCLEKGLDVRQAFIEASERANSMLYRILLLGKRYDPWLDDNGDAVGHGPESLGTDGALAATMTIGTSGEAPSVGEDAPIPVLFTQCYTRNGGSTILGYPVNKVHRWQSGYIQDFHGGEGYEGAIMHPDGVNESFAVYGCIWSKYLIMGGAGGPLGYPATDETEGPASSVTSALCRYNKFKGGAIVHRKATGIYESKTVFLGHGIFNKWEQLGYGASRLGLPVTDEYKNASGYPQVDFEAGYITTLDGKNYQEFLYNMSPSGHVEFPICIASCAQEVPAINGDIVVWQDCRNASYDIYGYDLSTQTEFAICTDVYSQFNPAISGNIAVWQDERNSASGDIYGYDLSTQTEMAICTQGAGQFNPAISGNIVVWQDYRNGNWDIYGYDLSTHTKYVICKFGGEHHWPAISGNIVVWTDRRNGQYDIYGYDLSTQTEFPICTNTADQRCPAVSGNIVVWTDYRNGSGDIYGYNLLTQTEFPICIDDEQQEYPAISGNIVVWQDNWTGDNDIYGYNLATQKQFAITFDSTEEVNPAISGNIVVWADNRNVNWDIYGKYISSHDQCENAIPVQLNVPYSGSTMAATGTDITSCGYNDKFDVWHSFTPTATYDYTISLCGSSFNTTLAVFDNCGGAELACNDDTEPGICSSTSQSQLTVHLVKGSTYLIRIAGYNGATGNYTLTVTGPKCTQEILGDANNDCKIDFTDFAIMASNWLECNLDPPEICW
jgi:beta propeller repeat protein